MLKILPIILFSYAAYSYLMMLPIIPRIILYIWWVESIDMQSLLYCSITEVSI